MYGNGLLLSVMVALLLGAPEFLRSHGVVVEILNDPVLVRMMGDFIKARPELWNEDIAE